MKRVEKFITEFEKIPCDEDKKTLEYHIMLVFDEIDSLEEEWKSRSGVVEVEDILFLLNYALVYLDFQYGQDHSLYLYYKLKCCQYYHSLGYLQIFWKHLNGCYFSFSNRMSKSGEFDLSPVSLFGRISEPNSERVGENSQPLLTEEESVEQKEDLQTLILFIKLFFKVGELRTLQKCLFDFWKYDKNNFSYQYFCSKLNLTKYEILCEKNAGHPLQIREESEGESEEMSLLNQAKMFIEASEKFIKNDKQREKFYLLQSKIQYELGNTQEAIQHLQGAYGTRKHDRILFQLGILYYKIHKAREEKQRMEEAPTPPPEAKTGSILDDFESVMNEMKNEEPKKKAPPPKKKKRRRKDDRIYLRRSVDCFKKGLRSQFDLVMFEKYVFILIAEKISPKDSKKYLKKLIEKQTALENLILYHIYYGDCCLEQMRRVKEHGDMLERMNFDEKAVRDEAKMYLGIALRLIDDKKKKDPNDRKKVLEIKKKLKVLK